MIDSKIKMDMPFGNNRSIRIIPKPWTQINFIFKDLSTDDTEIIISIYLPKSHKEAIICFSRDSEEGKALSQNLDIRMIGEEMDLLFTDIVGKKVLIKKSSGSSHKISTF